jgi:PAS domain S-box-containing protein
MTDPLIDWLPLPAWSADGAGRVEALNRRWRALAGVGDDFDPQRWLELVHPDDAPLAAALVAAALTDDDAPARELRLRGHDGAARWHLVRAAAAREVDGRVARLVCTATDIDALRQTQAQLGRAVALGEHFLGAVGHDLRNPLNTVVMSIALIERRAHDADVARWLSRMSGAAERMSNLVAEMHDFMRMRLGAGPMLERERVDGAELVRRVVEKLRAAHPGRLLALDAAGEHLGDLDPPRVELLVSKLVGNALLHGAPDAPVEVRLDAEGGQLRLTVHNGGALPPALAPSPFEPFRGRKPGGRGLGIGLFVAQQIAHAHGGTITACSSEEAGTTFEVRLPLAEPT